jgi:type IV pilus biogenesis protein CpaD/CtpE
MSAPITATTEQPIVTDEAPVDGGTDLTNSTDGLTQAQIDKLDALATANNNTELIQAEMLKMQAEGKINDMYFKSLMALLDRIEDSALR